MIDLRTKRANYCPKEDFCLSGRIISI